MGIFLTILEGAIMQSFTSMLQAVLGDDIVGLVDRVKKIEDDFASLATIFGATDVSAIVTKMEGYETTIADLAEKLQALGNMVIVADPPAPAPAPVPSPSPVPAETVPVVAAPVTLFQSAAPSAT